MKLTPKTKQFFALMVLLTLSSALSAQAEDNNSVRVKFTGTGNPVENEHKQLGTHITFTDDGKSINFTTNGATVTYPLDHVTGLTPFQETPVVHVPINKDPKSDYRYGTFYSSLEAYPNPNLDSESGIVAYKASIKGNGTYIKLVPIVGDFLPQGEPVLLRTQKEISTIDMSPAAPTGIQKSGDNIFDGVDVQTAEKNGDKKYYMFTYSTKSGLGFYLIGNTTPLAANKAYFTVDNTQQQMPYFLMDFDEETAIEGIYEETGKQIDTQIYNVGGMRLNKLQRGINIVNGKKVIVK